MLNKILIAVCLFSSVQELYPMQEFEATQNLLDAAESRDCNAFKLALGQGAHINVKVQVKVNGNEVHLSLIEYLALRGDLNLIKLLFEESTFCPAASSAAPAAIILAFESGNAEVANWLIEHGANANGQIRLRVDSEKTLVTNLIGYATYRGNFDFVKFLIKRGATFDNQRADLVLFILHSGNQKLIKWLIKQYPNLEKLDSIINQCLLFSKTGKHESGLLLLQEALSYGYNLNRRIPLWEGRTEGLLDTPHSPEITRWLIERGLTITRTQDLPAIFSEQLLKDIAHKDIEAAKKGLKKALIEKDYLLVESALTLASAQGVLQIVDEILMRAEINLKPEIIGVALECAALNGHENVVRTLYRYSPNSLSLCSYLERALFYATIQGARVGDLRDQYFAIVDFLLRKNYFSKLNIPLLKTIKRLDFLIRNNLLEENSLSAARELYNTMHKYEHEQNERIARSVQHHLNPHNVPVNALHNLHLTSNELNILL